MVESGAGVDGLAPCEMCGYQPAQPIPSCPRRGKPFRVVSPKVASAPSNAPSSTPLTPNPGRTVRRSVLGVDVGPELGESSGLSAPEPSPVRGPVSGPTLSRGDLHVDAPTSGPAGGKTSETVASARQDTVPEAGGQAPVELGRRLAAHLIDAALIGAISTCAYVVMLVLLFAGAMTGSSTMANLGGFLGFAFYMAVVAGSAVYFLRGMGRLGQTVGKRVLGMRVVDVHSHRTIGIGRAFGRFVYLSLMGLPCYLGYLTLITDKSGWHRGWHDTMAGSVVVSVPPAPFGQSIKDVWAAMRGRRVTVSHG